MSARGLETRLPPEVRQWLEGELIRRGFSDYTQVTDELNRRLSEAGADAASRSAVHRFGSKVEERIQGLKRATEIARAVASEAGDDEGALSDALIRLMQDKLFNAAMELELDPEEMKATTLARAIADLARASVQQKRHQIAVRAQVKAALDKLEESQKAKNHPLDAETLRRIREELYGVIG